MGSGFHLLCPRYSETIDSNCPYSYKAMGNRYLMPCGRFCFYTLDGSMQHFRGIPGSFILDHVWFKQYFIHN